ncbi:MAG: bifunctional nuclease family protein [Candidatus Tectomicrobia bacterium]
MKIGTVLFDQAKGAAIITLVEEEGERVLPIFIGMWEGMAIYREINRVASPRPLLHDLFHNILQGLHTRLEKVVVDSLGDATFFAQLHLRQHDTAVIADARPSDAVALAVKFQAPIYVAEAVLEVAGKRGDFAVPKGEGDEDQGTPATTEEIQSWLEDIRPEDFAEPQ